MKPGDVVDGKFRVERVLGQGGMGIVVVATHLKLDQTVALKFLHEHIAKDAAVVERLIREARASAKLKSEHACRIMDVDQLDNGTPYIVMELLEGNDLAVVLRKAPLSVATAAAYVLQACVAIAEAHAAGIVHRDLKPSNLFVTERLDGTPLVKVLDFGIAKAPQKGDFDITHTAAVMGSPGYMSPEQLRSAKDVDTRTDIWSLGVILYELVVGRLPFLAESITELAVKVTVDPFEPFPGYIDPAFARIAGKCLEKQTSDRYASVNALATDLARVAGIEGATSAALISKLASTAPSGLRASPSASSSADLGIGATLPATDPSPPATIETELPSESGSGSRRDPTPRIPSRAEPATTLSGLSGSAGTMSGKRATGSRGLVLGLAAVVVLGGGGAAAYLATRDPEPSAPAQAAKPSEPEMIEVSLQLATTPENAARAEVEFFGGTTRYAAKRIAPTKVVGFDIVLAVQGNAHFMVGDSNGWYPAIASAIDDLGIVERYKSHLMVDVFADTVIRVHDGKLVGVRASVLGAQRTYDDRRAVDLRSSLSQVVDQLVRHKFPGRKILVVVSRPGEIDDATRTRIAESLTRAKIELIYFAITDESPIGDIDKLPGQHVSVKDAGAFSTAFRKQVIDRIEDRERVVEFAVPETWTDAATGTVYFDNHQITFDIDARSDIIVE